MLQLLTASNNIGLFLIILLWMLIVRLALWTLDMLFPRIERSLDTCADSDDHNLHVAPREAS